MTVARKLRWIAFGVTLVGGVVLGLDYYKIGPFADVSQKVGVIVFAPLLGGLTLRLIASIMETKAKRLAKQDNHSVGARKNETV